MSYYSILIEQDSKSYNIIDLANDDIQDIVNAYLKGIKNITISGTKYYIKPNRIYFFEHEHPIDEKTLLINIRRNRQLNFEYTTATGYLRQNKAGKLYFTADFFLNKLQAKDITKSLIGNKGFGDEESKKETLQYTYVDNTIINDISNLDTTNFDYSKLLSLLHELNYSFSNQYYYSTSFLLRSIIDHIPPLFNKNTFAEVCNQHNFTRSDKNLVLKLQNFSRDVSDRELHSMIQKKVPLITINEVDFKTSLAALLKEIIRLHHI